MPARWPLRVGRRDSVQARGAPGSTCLSGRGAREDRSRHHSGPARDWPWCARCGAVSRTVLRS